MNLFDNTSIILLRPEKIRNLGQTARAMKNFSFTNLRIISPPAGNMKEAYDNAVNAKDILDNRQIFKDLMEAVKDLNILIGTTSRPQEMPLSPSELAELMIERPNLKYGIIFGTEFRGLSNEEISLCHRVVSIPTSKLYPSMNLSHSVAIICYELRKIFLSDEKETYIKKESLATVGELEDMLKHAERTLKNIGFLKEDAPGRLLPLLRRLTVNTEITSKEIRILRGILRQIDWIHSQTAATE